MIDLSRVTQLTIVDPDAFTNLSKVLSVSIYNSVKETVVGNLQQVIEGVIGEGVNWFNDDILNPVQEAASFVLSFNNIKQDNLSFFKFRVNPVRIQTSYRKIVDEKFTGRGHDLDTRGHEMIVKRFEVTSGSLVPIELISYDTYVTAITNALPSLTRGVTDDVIDAIKSNPKLSSSYIKFLTFQKFWETHNNDVLILFEDEAFLGKLLTLDDTRDANSPYEIKFNFDVKMYPGKYFNLYTGYLTEELFQGLKSTRNVEGTLSVSTNVEDISIDGLISSVEQAALNLLGENSNNKPKSDVLNFNRVPSNSNVTALADPLSLSRWAVDHGKTDIDIFEDTLSFNLFTLATQEIVVTADNNNQQSPITPPLQTEQEELNNLPTGP